MYCENQFPAGIIAEKKGCNTMVSFTEYGKNMPFLILFLITLTSFIFLRR